MAGLTGERISKRKQRSDQIRSVLSAVLVLNLLVAFAKVGYGVLSGSVSMTADGFQSLMDGASNVVGLAGMAIAGRPPDLNHPYGHRRFETLTSLGIALFMILALLQILQSVWNRWQDGGTPEVGVMSFVVMFSATFVSLGVTIWERRAGKQLNSSILTADARHTASDVLVSISVIGGLILVRVGFPVADLILAVLIAGVIAWSAWQIIRDAALSLSDEAVYPAPEIARAARDVHGVQGVHNVRTRGGEGIVWVDMHVQVDPDMSVHAAHDISSNVAERVEEEIGDPSDVTIHIEPATSRHLRPERNYRPDEN